MREELISSEKLEIAKKTALDFVEDKFNAQDLLSSNNLIEIETGIKKLNEFVDKCWLVSSLVMYTKIYDKALYEQSGLDWITYMAESRKRLGLEKRDVAERLSSARFFLKYHDKLIAAGWKPTGNFRKLARAELALELSGDIDLTVEHLTHDSWKDFNSWYSSFKVRMLVEAPKTSHNIEIKKNEFLINGKPAVTISDDLDEADKIKLQIYLNKIFTAMKNGVEPMFVNVSDAYEAKRIQTDEE